MMYRYWATVTKVHDGDTLSASIDLGFYLSMQAQIRLSGINAPELSTGAPGEAATIGLMGLIGFVNAPTRTKGQFGVEGDYLLAPGATAPRLVVATAHPKDYEKYGRVLGTLFVDDVTTLSVNQGMLDNAWAVAYP